MINCTKASYKTLFQAKKEAKRLQRKFHSCQSPYECSDCKMFHLASQKDNDSISNMIQSKKGEFIGRLSKAKTVWRVNIGKKILLVVYNKRYKTSRVVHRIENV